MKEFFSILLIFSIVSSISLLLKIIQAIVHNKTTSFALEIFTVAILWSIFYYLD